MLLKKIEINFAHKNIAKLLIIGPIFFSTGPAAQTAEKTEILYHQKPLSAGLGI